MNSLFGDYYGEEPLEPELHIWPDGCENDKNLDNFLNNDTIKTLLHVDLKSKWMQCNDTINENYTILII